jgi:hypothetical protein
LIFGGSEQIIWEQVVSKVCRERFLMEDFERLL